MANYSLTKGRKKEVRRFTIHRGLSVLAIVVAITVAILLLYILGYLPIDGD